MTIKIPVHLNKNRKLLLADWSGKFSEGDFKGELFSGGGIMHINMDDGRQFMVNVRDILSAIAEELTPAPKSYRDEE